MKKIMYYISASVITALMCIATPSFAWANDVDRQATIRASDYISAFGADINASSNSITINASMRALRANGVSMSITLQILDNGVWKSVTSWTESSSSSYTAASKIYNNPISGRQYRGVVQFNAIIDGSTAETRSMTTSSITAR